jgi:hypothetical protein
MLRRVLLGVMATVISFGLTAGGRYIMYTFARFAQESVSNMDCPSCGWNYFFTSSNSNCWVWDALEIRV